MKSRTVSIGDKSPYTLQNLDIAIAHLERIPGRILASAHSPGYRDTRAYRNPTGAFATTV